MALSGEAAYLRTFDQEMTLAQAILDENIEAIRECISIDSNWRTSRGGSGKSVRELATAVDSPAVYSELLRQDPLILKDTSPNDLLTKAINRISYEYTAATWLEEIEYFVFSLMEGSEASSLPSSLRDVPERDLDDLRFLFGLYRVWPDPNGGPSDFTPEGKWRTEFERWLGKAGSNKPAMVKPDNVPT